MRHLRHADDFGRSSGPRFRSLRPEIDEKLEVILHKALERDRNRRYQSASELLTDLEIYLYSDRYGPTNEKLAVYLRELFDRPEPANARLSSEPSPVV